MNIVKTKYFDKEQWKYTNLNHFVSAKNIKLSNNTNLELNCNKNEIIIYNGVLTLIGKKLKESNLIIVNIKRKYLIS